MSAGDERLPVFGENRPRKKDYQSVSTRASEESTKMVEHCLHSTLATMYLLAVHFLSTKRFIASITEFQEYQSIHH